MCYKRIVLYALCVCCIFEILWLCCISTGILIVVINIAFLGLVKWLAEYRKFLF